MRREQVHRLWAPPGVYWSRWVKPVLFSYQPEDAPPRDLPDLPTGLAAEILDALAAHPPNALAQGVLEPARQPHPYRHAPSIQDVAMVLDLPGEASALAGLALACHGFRPVPLYNGIPSLGEAVPHGPLMEALSAGAPLLQDLPAAAPPVFLLDSMRMTMRWTLGVGDFDNRWVSYPGDFPSAGKLWDAGIRRVVLVCGSDGERASDIATILRRWQNQGISFLVKAGDNPTAPAVVKGLSWYRRIALYFEEMGFSPIEPGGPFGARIVSVNTGSGG